MKVEINMLSDGSIEYLKSGISLNTQLGCKMNCAYCIVDEFQKGIKRTYLPEDLVNDGLGWNLYDEKIPLFINNRTEPFWGYLKEETLSVLAILKKMGIKNKKVIISKLPLGKLKDYDALVNNNVYLFRTISGLPLQIEPYCTKENLNSILKENTFLRKETDIKLLHYWRPIIRGLNTDKKILVDLLNKIIPNFDASVISGIRLTNRLRKHMEALGADFSDWNSDINHKFLPRDILHRMFDIRDKLSKAYPLFTKTSCGISFLAREADYNLHHTKEKNLFVCKQCKNYKLCLDSLKIPNEKILNECFSKIGKKFDYRIVEKSVHVITPINQSEISYIKNTTHYNVEAENILKNPSESKITEIQR